MRFSGLVSMWEQVFILVVMFVPMVVYDQQGSRLQKDIAVWIGSGYGVGVRFRLVNLLWFHRLVVEWFRLVAVWLRVKWWLCDSNGVSEFRRSD